MKYGSLFGDGSEISYRFRINDGRDSPEPAYNETKASILRRRNTMAKMIQEEEQQFINNIKDPRSRGRASMLQGRNKSLHSQRRHWSLGDIPRNSWPSNQPSNIRRWNSVSNDELIGHLGSDQLSSSQIVYNTNGRNLLLVPTGTIKLNSSFSPCELHTSSGFDL